MLTTVRSDAFCSPAQVHPARQDEEEGDRPPRGQLHPPQVRGQRQPQAWHHLAEGQQAPHAPGDRGEQEEEVDVEPEEPEARGQREVHLQGV